MISQSKSQTLCRRASTLLIVSACLQFSLSLVMMLPGGSFSLFSTFMALVVGVLAYYARFELTWVLNGLLLVVLIEAKMVIFPLFFFFNFMNLFFTIPLVLDCMALALLFKSKQILGGKRSIANETTANSVSGTPMASTVNTAPSNENEVREPSSKARAMQTISQADRRFLIILNVVFGILIFPAGLIAMFSAMMFDSPGSENEIWKLVMYYSINSYPFVTILSIVLTWTVLPLKGYNWAYYMAILPLIPIGLMFVAFVVYIALATSY